MQGSNFEDSKTSSDLNLVGAPKSSQLLSLPTDAAMSISSKYTLHSEDILQKKPTPTPTGSATK